MYRHLVFANDFYIESLEGLNDPMLDNLLERLNAKWKL